MKPRNFSICVAVVFGLAIGAFYFTNAQAGSSGKSGDTVRVSALTEPFTPTSDQRDDLSRLSNQLDRSQAESIAPSIEASDARPVPLPAGLGTAWVASAPDGGVCTFIPDPLGGFGSSCATQADLRAGGAITVLGGAGELKNQAIAVLVVPDGGSTPVVTSPDGTQRAAPVPGVGATLVRTESRVSIGGVSIRVPKSDSP